MRTGSPSTLQIDESLAARARAASGDVVEGHDADGLAIAVRHDVARNEFHAATIRSPAARAATTKLYLLLTVSLLAVYGLLRSLSKSSCCPSRFICPSSVFAAPMKPCKKGGVMLN